MNSEWKEEQFFQSSVVRIVRPSLVSLVDVIKQALSTKVDLSLSYGVGTSNKLLVALD